MNETVKEISSLMDEVSLISQNPDAWWEKEKERKEALNRKAECAYCLGTGIAHVQDGPDDFEEVECVCRNYPENDPRFEQYEEKLS